MTLPATTDYTDRDFDAVRLRLQALIHSAFPEWTDFDAANFGNILVDLFAHVADVLGYYQDAQLRETRLTTATQRRNVIALARLLGYRLHGSRAARCDVEFRLSRPAVSQVTIPAGTFVRTEEISPAIRFQTLSAAVFPPGLLGPVLVATEHSQIQQKLTSASGLADFEVALEQRPFLDGSLSITTAAGAWSEVETFLGSGPTDRHFAVEVDDSDRATVRFGDGRTGAIPTGTVTLRYRTGGGASGNVESGRLTVLDGAISDAAGRPVIVSVTNPQAASGGAARESAAAVKLRAPASLRATSRCVCREDFEIRACEVPGVARALMLTSNEDRGIPENQGILFVVPVGGGLPTPALKNAVHRQVTEVYPCTLTFQVRVQDPVYRRLNLRARLFLRAGANPATVGAAVRSRLASAFAISANDGTPNAGVNFGFNLRDAFGNPAGEVAWSDLFNLIRDTPGVRKLGDGRDDLLVNGLPADVKLLPAEFPVLGEVLLVDGDSGAPL